MIQTDAMANAFASVIGRGNNMRYKENKHIVYFMKVVDQDIYKIGHSRDIRSMKNRRTVIQQYCPFSLKIAGFAEINDAIKTEKMVHEELKEFKMKGEWFRIPAEHIYRIDIFIMNRSKFYIKYLQSIGYITLSDL